MRPPRRLSRVGTTAPGSTAVALAGAGSGAGDSGAACGPGWDSTFRSTLCGTQAHHVGAGEHLPPARAARLPQRPRRSGTMVLNSAEWCRGDPRHHAAPQARRPSTCTIRARRGRSRRSSRTGAVRRGRFGLLICISQRGQLLLQHPAGLRDAPLHRSERCSKHLADFFVGVLAGAGEQQRVAQLLRQRADEPRDVALQFLVDECRLPAIAPDEATRSI